jgi:hypothetical protein
MATLAKALEINKTLTLTSLDLEYTRWRRHTRAEGRRGGDLCSREG